MWKSPMAVVSPYAVVGLGTKVWAFAQVMENVVIGKNCSIGHGVLIGRWARIGDNVRMKAHVAIGSANELDAVTIEDDVFIANNVVVMTAPDARFITEVLAVRLKRGCMIAPNVVIALGVTIGEGADVGPNLLLAHDVPDRAIVRARPTDYVAGWRCVCGKQLDGPKPYCGDCKRFYGVG